MDHDGLTEHRGIRISAKPSIKHESKIDLIWTYKSSDIVPTTHRPFLK